MAASCRKRQNQSEDAISDQACTRCRERKIRCGRELPQCTNCERDDNVECVYQNPTKRVNHLKLLFDSVNGLNERLSVIESSLGRLSVSIEQNKDKASSASNPSTRQSSVGEGPNDEEDDHSAVVSMPPSDDRTDLHIFHNQEDMVDYYHGPLSLFSLCKHFRAQALSATDADLDTPTRDMLQDLCDKTGEHEPFPSFGGQPQFSLPPRQRANTIIGHFFRHIDCVTDVFVQSNLLAQIERVYSQPTDLETDVWAICFQAIIVLVWGREFSTQASNDLLGDFARSFIPSRAALVNSRLLTTPRLINVQTLILLSVATQEFDPPGWAEFIFANACALARVMGLHQAQLFPPETSSNETLERAKVLRSLYVRDKALCTTRGSVSWLPTQDCNIPPQLSVAKERRVPYLEKLQMAMIQDDIYHLAHTALSRKSKSVEALRSIEQKLNQFVQTFGIFDRQASGYDLGRALLTLQFLAARIHALQYGDKQRHRDQVRSDARVSCLLLLIVHGAQDRHVIDTFNALASRPVSRDQDENSPAVENGKIFLSSVLSAFPLSAFFILLQDVIQAPETAKDSNAELDLLRGVAACYTNSAEQMQFNNSHRKVARTFEQLLKIVDLIRKSELPQPTSISPFMSMSYALPPLDAQINDPFGVSSSHTAGFGSSSFTPPRPMTSTSFSWDTESSIQSSWGLCTTNSTDASEIMVSDVLDHVGGGSPKVGLGDPLSWLEVAPESSISKKRMRTQ